METRMPTVFSFVSTKGGVGKTTLAANLAGILADYGMRVLALDADIQPSLSKFYPLLSQAPSGLRAVVMRGGNVLEDCISRTVLPNLDLIYSDTPDGSLQTWLKDREDRLMILRRAMASPVVQPYNVVIIDTQGAVGELQKTAAMAADYMISPIKPDTLSAGEFSSGTLAMLDDLNRLADFGESFQSGDMFALINAQERNNNLRRRARVIFSRLTARIYLHAKLFQCFWCQELNRLDRNRLPAQHAALCLGIDAHPDFNHCAFIDQIAQRTAQLGLAAQVQEIGPKEDICSLPSERFFQFVF